MKWTWPGSGKKISLVKTKEIPDDVKANGAWCTQLVIMRSDTAFKDILWGHPTHIRLNQSPVMTDRDMTV